MGAQKRCIHCLRSCEKEDDHVFPDSWYPDSTPNAVQRWTAPSCPRCNRTFGELETDLLARLIGCIDPKSKAASGLHVKALRSLGIDAGELSPRERSIREARRKRIWAEYIPTNDLADKPGLIPGLGPTSDQAAPYVVPFPIAALSMIAEKIARGCEYKYEKRKLYIEPPRKIETFVENAEVTAEQVRGTVNSIDFGPGCKVLRGNLAEHPEITLYWMTIWDSLHLHARIGLQEELRRLGSRRFDGFELDELKTAMKVPDYLRNFD